MNIDWKRGRNTPEKQFPNPPIFTEPCKPSAKGAWRNLGGWWVKEKQHKECDHRRLFSGKVRIEDYV